MDRQLQIMAWDSVTPLHIQRQPIEDTPPKFIDYNGKRYHHGQVSGPAMLIVWYEEG